MTDGGAADNRGAISLLFALSYALKRIEDASKLPDIHIIVADASALTVDYTPASGCSAIFGAPSKFASELIRWVHRDNIERICAIRDVDEARCNDSPEHGVDLHILEMPRVFTTRSGLGTHWKLPWWVTFTDPRQPDGYKADEVTVFRSTAVSVIAALHGEGSCDDRMGGIDLSPRVVEWVNNDAHIQTWERLVGVSSLGQE